MGQSQSWLNNGNVFVNIYSVKILPKFTILLIMNYLISSRQNSQQNPWRYRSANKYYACIALPPQGLQKCALLASLQERIQLCCYQLSQSFTVVIELLSQGWTESGLWAELGTLMGMFGTEIHHSSMPIQKPHVQINGCI